MVLIKEYRVILPVTCDEYKVGQLYSVARASAKETSSGEGVEVLKNEPYETEGGEKGQYTHKIYHIGNRLPGWIRAILPVSLLQIHEEAWNAFPHCKTVLTSPFFGEKFRIVVESQHVLNDRGKLENALNVDAETLKKREIVNIDISDDNLFAEKKEYTKEEDPKLHKSEKTGRGPLTAGWVDSAEPVMCAYKLVTAEAKIWGFQGKLENKIHEIQTNVFFKFHRQVFCWLDEWINMTMDDVRAMEEEYKKKLAEQLAHKDEKAHK